MGRIARAYPDLRLIEGLEPVQILFLHLTAREGLLVWARVIYSDTCDVCGIVTPDVSEALSLLAPDCATWLSKIRYSEPQELSEKQKASIKTMVAAHKQAARHRRAANEFASEIGRHPS